MANQSDLFDVSVASSQQVSVGTSSAPTTLVAGHTSVLVYNQGSADCYINIGETGTTVAVGTGVCIPAGIQLMLGKSGNKTVLATIGAAATTLQVSTSVGI